MTVDTWTANTLAHLHCCYSAGEGTSMSKQAGIHVRGGATNATASNPMEHSRFAMVNSNFDPIRASTLIRFDTLRQDFHCLQSGRHTP